MKYWEDRPSLDAVYNITPKGSKAWKAGDMSRAEGRVFSFVSIIGLPEEDIPNFVSEDKRIFESLVKKGYIAYYREGGK